MAFTLGGHDLATGSGTWVQVPAGVRHQFSFLGGEPPRFFTIHSPSCRFGEFLRALDRGEDDERAVASSGFDQEAAR